MRKGKAFIGTSGWHYKHWKEVFYPSGIPERKQFSFYCEHFNSVEINNSFYILPASHTFSGWTEKAPPSFIFAGNASRFRTHMKKRAIANECI